MQYLVAAFGLDKLWQMVHLAAVNTNGTESGVFRGV